MPIEPPTSTVASASTVTAPSPVPGPSRVTYQKRADSKDIPSDDSDTGGSQSPSFKKRFRKRKYIPVPRNLMSMVKKPKSEIVASTPVSQNGSRRTTRDMDGVEIASTSSMCPSPVQEQCSEEDKCTETTPAVIVPTLRNSRFMSNNLLLDARRWSAVALDNDASSAIQLRNGLGNSNPRYLGDSNVDSETKCVLYSLWNPSLDLCLKCDNGKLLMEAQQFREFITESIAHVTPLPDFYRDHKDFEVIYVEGAEVDEHSGTWKVYGKWCYNNEETSGSNAEIHPAPSVIGKLLSSMLSASDLLILVKSTDSNCASFTEKYSCVIHITSKNYKKACYPLPNHLKLDSMNPMMQSEQNEVMHEHYGSYTIEKYVLLHDVPDCERNPLQFHNGPLPIEMPTCNGAINATRKDYANSSCSSSANAQCNVNGETTHKETTTNKDLTRDNQMLEQEHSPSPTVNTDPELVGIVEESDESNEPSLAAPVPVTPRRPSNFSLEYWINEGLFTPGVLRPKVRKSDSKKSYQYHKLMELALMLRNSVDEDVQNKQIPNMMVKQQCHAYGVVVEVMEEHRHLHSHFFRISDETRESVLVRIHGNEKAIGPQIEKGHIVRLHRLTVQMEWDVGAGENAMVLSTSPHHNYVIFKETDKTYLFSYETCANAITLSDYDRRRVGELQLFKTSRGNQTLANEVSSKEEAMLNCARHRNTIKDIDSAIFDASKKSSHAAAGSQVLNSQTSAVGICASDIASPMNSELGSSLECSQNRHGVQDLIQSEHVRSPSEDSFSSALSALSGMEPEIVHPQTSPRCINNDNIVNNLDAQQRPGCLTENMDIENLLATMANESQTHHLDFTLFKNLRKTDQKLNILCQIVTLGATSSKNVWHLIIKDLEHTLPSDEFKQSALDSHRGDDFLQLNIINAKSLVDRNIVLSLYNDQGTDDFYMIEDVKIKGDEPPYCLEVDGKTCNIQRYNHLMQYLQLEESFSAIRSCESESEVSDSLENNRLREDDATHNSHNEKQNQAGPSSHRDAPTPCPSPVGRDLAQTRTTCPSPLSSQSSAYVTAPQTPSPKPATAAEVFGDSQRRTVSRKLEVWTGKSKGKRKPREHYQPEESFDG